jgi:hypothetical protein
MCRTDVLQAALEGNDIHFSEAARAQQQISRAPFYTARICLTRLDGTTAGCHATGSVVGEGAADHLQLGQRLDTNATTCSTVQNSMLI